MPVVENVTVNLTTENAKVRYNETCLEANDIKSAVRQKSYESDAKEPPEVEPVEDKAEDPATTPAVNPPEEKDKAETIPQAIEEKIDEHAGHKVDEMPKDEAANSNELLPTTKEDKL